jgi:hypothetical protein
VLSIANQVFAVELWCLQQIRFSLSNCVVCNESGFRCRIVLSAANQFLSPNGGVCTESVFAAEW